MSRNSPSKSETHISQSIGDAFDEAIQLPVRQSTETFTNDSSGKDDTCSVLPIENIDQPDISSKDSKVTGGESRSLVNLPLLKPFRKFPCTEPTKKVWNLEKPNYFVAVPLTSPEVVSQLADVQRQMVSKEPRLENYLTSDKKFHLTLMVFKLDAENDHDRDEAIKALQICVAECKELVASIGSKFNLDFMSDFDKRVIFASISDVGVRQTLSKIAETCRLKFADHNMTATDKKFYPHVTLFKIKYQSRKGPDAMSRLPPSLYEDFSSRVFGETKITKFQLCAMDKPSQENGYYHVLHEIMFDEDKNMIPENTVLPNTISDTSTCTDITG